MNDTINSTEEIEYVSWPCAACGCIMYMPKMLNDCYRESHRTFYCLSGHANVYSKKTDIEEAEGKLVNEYAKNAQLEGEIKKLRTENDQLKKSIINRLFKP